MKEARIHLNFCITLYRDQVKRGKHFLHEHPVSASSWREESVELIANHPQVDTVVGDMCQYGMNIEEQPGIIKPVEKGHTVDAIQQCHAGAVESQVSR